MKDSFVHLFKYLLCAITVLDTRDKLNKTVKKVLALIGYLEFYVLKETENKINRLLY